MSVRIFAALVLAVCSISAHAQVATDEKGDAEKARELSKRVMIIQRLTMDTTMAEQLELAPDQRKKMLIANERFQDATRELYGNRRDKPFDAEAYNTLAKKFFTEAEAGLTERQREKLAELEIKPRQSAAPAFSREKMQEHQKLQSVMREFQRLSYDRELAEQLEVTAEQRVEIREAQRKFMEAQREQMKSAADGSGGFDLEQYNQKMEYLMIEAQDILTPEQIEILSKSAKLKRLKSSYGDEFGMIIGLADDFEMDEQDKAKLREKVQEARMEYYDTIEQLKVDTLEKIVRTLPAKHREEAREAAESFFKEDAKRRQQRERIESMRAAAPTR
ncbi:hypothetical protein NHH03_17310 [Stieleria sp. TO1_6]|uniref:hypothetical protein n=1 Tax=Stieleria tagensis TaxID=2956795 RepID=UPI00209AFF4D|nr:hypothetical protein [Stieleria tagensis]MCO8123509.1 hypothetical protein [Stieleria tagensis]